MKQPIFTRFPFSAYHGMLFAYMLHAHSLHEFIANKNLFKCLLDNVLSHADNTWHRIVSQQRQLQR